MEWDLTDGKLTVTGRIVREDIRHEKAPWYERREEITSVVMRGSGVGDFFAVFSTYSIDGDNYIQCYPNVQTIDLSGLDTSAVTDMSSMFSNCESLVRLDLSSFDTSAVKEVGRYGFESMFEYCKNLTEILVDGNKWNLDPEEAFFMFRDCGVSEVTKK